MRVIICLLIGVLLFTSCEEPPITKPPKSADVIQRTLSMGPENNNQLFYSLLEDTLLKTGTIFDWDIAIGMDGSTPILTVGWPKTTTIAKSSHTEMDSVKSVANLKFELQEPYALQNLTQNWHTNNKVYVIDIVSGGFLGHYKLKFLELKGTDTVSIQIAKLNGSSNQVLDIPIETTGNYTYLKLSDYAVKNIEPLDPWDFVFSKYTSELQSGDSTIFYLVVGMMFNPQSVASVGMKKSTNFEDFNIASAQGLTYSTKSDAIGGFNWKELKSGSFNIEVYSDVVYAIRFQNGAIYKLHFLDYFNDNNESGYPFFEFQKLN